MHDIKYFVLNKINQTIQIYKLLKALSKSTIFQNPGGSSAADADSDRGKRLAQLADLWSKFLA
jgi:hypothetical protein